MDYQCPACKEFYFRLRSLLTQNKEWRVIIKQNPILDESGKPGISTAAAKLALASVVQGKFVEANSALFEKKNLSIQAIKDIYHRLNINTENVNSQKIADHLTASKALAADLGVNYTPAFIIGDTFIHQSEADESKTTEKNTN